jgi:hypothetical protein
MERIQLAREALMHYTHLQKQGVQVPIEDKCTVIYNLRLEMIEVAKTIHGETLFRELEKIHLDYANEYISYLSAYSNPNEEQCIEMRKRYDSMIQSEKEWLLMK